MIDIQNLYKRYHNHHGSPWVLKDINLQIPKGVSVGLVGRNGAGKSTLLRLIAGMDHPDRGRIERHSRVSWPIGLAGGFQGSMTGRQNVKFVARVHGGRGNERDIIERVQAFAEIGNAFDEPIRTYSSGMRARLNFGLSLAFDFDVYLSDEATSVGDRSFKAKATKAFKEKVGQASLIMVSHGESILEELCQSGIYLKDGRAIWYDKVTDAIAAYHDDTDSAQKTSKPGAPLAPQTLPPAETQQEARQQLAQRKDELRQARTAFEEAKTRELAPAERKSYGEAYLAAKENYQMAKQRLQRFDAPGTE